MSLGNQTGTITLRIIAEDLASGHFSTAIGKMDAMAQKGGLMGSVMQGVGIQMGMMLNPVMLIGNAIGVVGDAIGNAMGAAVEGQVSAAKLNASLAANVAGWNGNAEAIDRVIASRLVLGFTDNEQQDALAGLTAHTNDVSNALFAERIAMDLARFKGLSLADAANAVGKAWDGNTTALQRMGVEMPKGAAGMAAMGALTAMTNGQAVAFSNTLAGKQAGLNAAVDSLNEKVGNLIIGPATDFLGWLGDMISPSEKAVTSLDSITDAYNQQTAAMKEQKAATDAAKNGTDALGQSWRDFDNVYATAWKGINSRADDRTQFIEDEKAIAMQAGQSSEAVGRYFDAIIAGGGTASDAYATFVADVIKSDGKLGSDIVDTGSLFFAQTQVILQAAANARQAMSGFMRGGFSSGWSHWVPPSAAGGGGNGFAAGGGSGGPINIHFNGMVTPPSPADAQRIGNVIGPIVARHLQSSGHL